jgi:tRNA threonylcarbamoyladenosine biosynthesis protein TsaB
MRILGLETSTAVCSVGLFREGTAGVERSLRESHIHSEKLLTLVKEVMVEAGISLKELDAIAISVGPGSFTGLRIGLSTAKGLSFALGKPLVSVPTFEAIAAAGHKRNGRFESVAVLIDAKKEEWYMGRYRLEKGTMIPDGPVHITSLEDAAGAMRGVQSLLVLTDKVDEVKRSLDNAATIEDVHDYCRGDVVAAVAHPRVINHEFADASALEPMYLKDFVVRSVSAAR